MRVTLSAVSLVLACGILISGLSVEAKGKPGVTYRPAGEATLNYDGVTVHRHADGSVEVSDPESPREPLYPVQSQPARRTVRKRVAVHKAAAKKATTTTTTKTKSK